ncbi:MAG: hypothetical protein AAF433_18815 [Bacteroidota bacterium]
MRLSFVLDVANLRITSSCTPAGVQNDSSFNVPQLERLTALGYGDPVLLNDR